MARTVSLLCSLGHLTFSWNPANDSLMSPIIQKMIDNGTRFFILRKKEKQVPVTKLTQAMDTRKIVIPDESLQSLFATGILTVGSLIAESVGPEIATSVEQVLENDTMATQPVAGG